MNSIDVRNNIWSVTLVDTTTYDRLRSNYYLCSQGIVRRSYDKSCVNLVVVGSRTFKIDRTQVFDHVQKFACNLYDRSFLYVFSSRAIGLLQVLSSLTLPWMITRLSNYTLVRRICKTSHTTYRRTVWLVARPHATCRAINMIIIWYYANQ